MKSIRSKVIAVVLCSVLATTVLLLFISLVSINILNRNDSDLLLEYIVRENSALVNSSLEAMEQTVDSIVYYAVEQLGKNRDRLEKDLAWREEYIKKVESLAVGEAANTRDVASVYFRLDYSLGEPSGFLYQYYEGTGKLEKHILTDITMYERDDMEHVGWYYIPKDAEKPVWLGPYDNYNLKMRMISYEVPIMYNNEFLGVIGMDVNVHVTNRDLANISVYQTGGAILFDKDFNLVYHKSHVRGLAKEHFSESQNEILRAALEAVATNCPVEYNFRHDKLFATRLRDGMILCITAPIDEIHASRRSVIGYSLLGSILILAIIMGITTLQINSFLRPLNKLTEAAEKLADGNMEVKFDHSKQHKDGAKDEIERLSDTFEIMAKSLKHYFDHFHSLAYTDNMTGLNNKAAFQMTQDVIESEVNMGRAAFTIVVMDVNNLKTINDSIGHEKGDLLLKHASSCMRDTFVGFPLYRIGGDEFCSIINNSVEPALLIARLQEAAREMSAQDFGTFKVSYQIAAGSAVYDRNSDKSFQDVFNRADQAMYENKKKIKKAGADS